MRRAKRCLGYARVSSIGQTEGSSLQDQQNVIRAYAKRSGLNAPLMFVEAESAVHEKFEKREQVQALLASVREGDLVLVDKLDRWSRDAEFSYRSIREILAAGASFYAIGDDCDPSTPQGDTALGFRILLAREEYKRIKQRLVGTRKTLRGHGYYADGPPPWGYVRPVGARGVDKNVLLIDESNADRVREVFRLCIEGSSMMAIADAMQVDVHSVARVLHNRTLLGEVRDGQGNWVPGKHPPLLDARTFHEAQLAIERRKNGDRRRSEDSTTATWWLRGLARCALCSGTMSSAWAGRGPTRYDYFKCFAKCTTGYVAVRRVEKQSSPMVEARLVALGEQIANAKHGGNVTRMPDVGERQAKLQRKRARALEAYTDGMMSRDELRETMAKIDAERTRLDALRQQPAPVTSTALQCALRDVAAMARAWNAAPPKAKRTIVNAIASAVYVAKGLEPRFEWYSAEILARRGEV